MKRPQVDGEKVRDRFQRGIILFAVAIFLIGSVGIYIFVFFTDKQSTDPTQQAIEKQLEEAQKQQKEQQKTMQIDPTFIVPEPITALKTEDQTTGTGKEATKDSTVKVKYKGGMAKDGKIFDQSSEPIATPNEWRL